MKLKQIYNLQKDLRQIKIIQEASFDQTSKFGYQTTNGLLFGTKEWFNAIKRDIITKHTIQGIITRVYMSGHNDFPEFEMQNENGKTTWMRYGVDEAYKVGKQIEIIYVEQYYKNPINIIKPISQCVIDVKIEI